MSKFRKSNNRTDTIQPEIVDALRDIPGVDVCLGHDDILIGYKNRTYWVELKSSEKASRQSGQVALQATWPGHYKICWSLDMVLEEIGIKMPSKPPQQ